MFADFTPMDFLWLKTSDGGETKKTTPEQSFFPAGPQSLVHAAASQLFHVSERDAVQGPLDWLNV